MPGMTLSLVVPGPCSTATGEGRNFINTERFRNRSVI
jgi:hypothetical protein